MRDIVIDTETTGLEPLDGHRIVEIGVIELVNRIPTGNTFHAGVRALQGNEGPGGHLMVVSKQPEEERNEEERNNDRGQDVQYANH